MTPLPRGICSGCALSRPLVGADHVVRRHRSPWGGVCPGTWKPPDEGRPKVKEEIPYRPRGTCPVCRVSLRLTPRGVIPRHLRGHIDNPVVCHGTGAEPRQEGAPPPPPAPSKGLARLVDAEQRLASERDPDPRVLHEMACVGCGKLVGMAAQQYTGRRRNLFACDACQQVIKRFVSTMKARGYAATDLFHATFDDTPGFEARKALPPGGPNGSPPALGPDE
jgi:hypothetical protein